MTPATEHFEKFILGGNDINRDNYWKLMIIRTVGSILTCGLVAAIPDLTNLLNITSGIALTWQSFVFGPILYVKARSSEFSSTTYYVVVISVLNGILGLFGALIGSFAIYLAVRDLIGHATHSL